MATWPGWDRDLLTALRAPINANTLLFLDQWQSFEGGSARNNPLNTTQPEPGATNYNTAGVKNYLSSAQGTKATVTTLENGRYGSILAALRSGSPFTYGNKGSVATQIQTWGTFGFANWYLQQGIAPQPGVTVGPTPALAGAARTLAGYDSFQHALAHSLPRALHDSGKLTAATLQRIGARGKVR